VLAIKCCRCTEAVISSYPCLTSVPTSNTATQGSKPLSNWFDSFVETYLQQLQTDFASRPKEATNVTNVLNEVGKAILECREATEIEFSQPPLLFACSSGSLHAKL